MPRERRTQTGAPAQPIGAIAGQVYGAGEEQMAMQRAMPAPQVAGAGPGATAPAAPGPAAVDPAMLMQRAQALAPETGLLTTPTARPNEPVTAGLASGPGAGPMALQRPQGSPAGNMLRKLTEATGDPSFAELARRARS